MATVGTCDVTVIEVDPLTGGDGSVYFAVITAAVADAEAPVTVAVLSTPDPVTPAVPGALDVHCQAEGATSTVFACASWAVAVKMTVLPAMIEDVPAVTDTVVTVDPIVTVGLAVWLATTDTETLPVACATPLPSALG